MPRGYFVTGTDTDVGKTVVSAALTLALGASYWKPVQTGSPADRAQIQGWTQLPDSRFAPEQWRFPLPASPHIAARAAGGRIELRDLRPPWLAGAAAEASWIVEGAGGVLVPLNERERMADLIARLGLPVIVVARTRLGTINHTLLTLEALRHRQLAIACVVMNGESQPEVAETIKNLGNTPLARMGPISITSVNLLKTGEAILGEIDFEK